MNTNEITDFILKKIPRDELAQMFIDAKEMARLVEEDIVTYSRK